MWLRPLIHLAIPLFSCLIAKPMTWRDLIENLELKEPVLLGNLMVVPLEGSLNSREFGLLHLALEEGRARVRELGMVEKVLVENPSLDDLFVLEGEELLGARQDRVAVSSAVIPAREELELPVVCIEEGRWAGDEPLFRGGYVAHPRLRSLITLSIRGSGKADQQKVWREVERKLTSLKISSATGSLHHSFTYQEGTLEELYGGWNPGERVTGAMAFTPKGFLCCDILANPSLFSGEWPGLLKGYALDALEERIRGRRGKMNWQRIAERWERVGKTKLVRRLSSRGKGEEWLLEGPGEIGRALITEDGLIYASIHPA